MQRSIPGFEALFLGAAGLLPPQSNEPYISKLIDEYSHISRKFGICSLPSSNWRFLRMRPNNFPTIKLVQLASIYRENNFIFHEIVMQKSLPQIKSLLTNTIAEYWKFHFKVDDLPHKMRNKRLGTLTFNSLMINSIIPTLSAYGRYYQDMRLLQRAGQWLNQLPAEENNIVRLFSDAGIVSPNAQSSQGMIELYKSLCVHKQCLHCDIGRRLIRSK